MSFAEKTGVATYTVGQAVEVFSKTTKPWSKGRIGKVNPNSRGLPPLDAMTKARWVFVTVVYESAGGSLSRKVFRAPGPPYLPLPLDFWIRLTCDKPSVTAYKVGQDVQVYANSAKDWFGRASEVNREFHCHSRPCWPFRQRVEDVRGDRQGFAAEGTGQHGQSRTKSVFGRFGPFRRFQIWTFWTFLDPKSPLDSLQ